MYKNKSSQRYENKQTYCDVVLTPSYDAMESLRTEALGAHAFTRPTISLFAPA